MRTVAIRQKLHEFIDTLEDKRIKAVYTLLIDEVDPEMQRKKLILAEREKYLKSKEKTYSWAAVKQMALHKEKRNALES